eukprot:11227830-Lingulodinium_polyedra.AAC.1
MLEWDVSTSNKTPPAHTWVLAWVLCGCCSCISGCWLGAGLVLIGCCVGAARVLLGRCLGAAWPQHGRCS